MLDRRAALGLIAGSAAAPLAAQTGVARLSGRTRIPLFPQKRALIVQRVRPPLLETPFETFDQGVFTPNDRFYVRWHYADIPTAIDPARYRLAVSGAVSRPLALSLAELGRLPAVELAAVNQCSGNSRSFVTPRVAGAQWGHGAMGNALWRGVRLKDVLARAGVRGDARFVRFSGLDKPPTDIAPAFAKTLALDHALSDEVILAYAMNGAPLPYLNGYPLRLIVPGWFSTYWLKALDRIELLAEEDHGFWMAKAYRLPDTPDGGIAPGATGFATRPIGPMPPRSFITNRREGAQVAAGAPLSLRGIAFGGTSAVARVELAVEGGPWREAVLGPDMGRYGFRRWSLTLPAPAPGALRLSVRATNSDGARQQATPIWNPGGYMRSTIETITLVAQ